MATISFDLTIPKDYNKATHEPLEKVSPIGPGRIKSITAQFPAGCQFLAKLQVAVAASGNPKQPILPSQVSQDGLDYIALDDFVQEFPVNVVLMKTTLVYVRGWNEDDTYSHEIKVTVNMD